MDCRTLTGSSSGPTGRINTMPNGGAPISITGCNTKYCTPDGNGGFRNFKSPTATDFGDNYNFQPLNYLFHAVHPREPVLERPLRHQRRNTHVFFEGQFNNRKSTQQLAEEPIQLALFGLTISRQHLQPAGPGRHRLQPPAQGVRPRTFNQASTRPAWCSVSTATSTRMCRWSRTGSGRGRTTTAANDSTNSTHGDVILSHLANALGPKLQRSGSRTAVRYGGQRDPELRPAESAEPRPRLARSDQLPDVHRHDLGLQRAAQRTGHGERQARRPAQPRRHLARPRWRLPVRAWWPAA